MPPISCVFGLFKDKVLMGICSFGDGGGNTMLHKSFDEYKMLELNRLCIDENSPHNSASFFISRCFKLMERPVVIISYADTNQDHVGYIYQALNFIYTGEGSGDIKLTKGGKTIHRKTLYDMYGTGSIETAIKHGYKVERQKPKHRYIYFLGSKKQKKEMLKTLKWPVLPYPKGESKRYDTSKPLVKKGLLY